MPWPDICVEDKGHCPNKWATLKFRQQTCMENYVTLVDEQGAVLELHPDTHTVYLVTKHQYRSVEKVLEVEAEITDPDENPGQVRVTLDATDSLCPGLFLGEFVVYPKEVTAEESSSSSPEGESSSAPEDPCAIYRISCFLEIAVNLTNVDARFFQSGVTISEVRLALRDNCPEDNFLLDCVEFDDTEIAWAIRRPIDLWNDTPPDLRRYRYHTQNFPWRYYWIQGIIAELFSTAAYNYERNNLKYAAANLSVDDKHQARSYHALSQELKKECYRWILQKKKELNMNQCYGTANLRAFGNQHLRMNPGYY